jgi:hypothetical protein
MTHMIPKAWFLVLAVGLAAAPGCGSDDDDTGTDTDTDSDSDGDCSAALLPGDWLSDDYSVRFASDLSYEAAGAPNLEEIDVTGQAAVDGCEISLTDLTGGVYACPEAQVGVYTFTVSETTLTFALVSDACDGRRIPLDGDVLTRD